MDVAGLLADLYGRVEEEVRGSVEGLTAAQLATAPEPGANTIGWLVWHLTRVEDGHIAELLEQEQLWPSSPWPARFELTPDPHDSGYGHTAEQVLAVRADGPDALLGYFGAVRERTSAFIATLTPDDLDRIVDRRW